MNFGLQNILVQKVSDANFRAYYIGYDFKACRLDAFCNKLMNALVDFAFGYHTGILEKYNRDELIEAAKSIYKISSYSDIKLTYVDDDSVLDDEELRKAEDKVKKRGEFGELILHAMLRDYFHTTPLLSKIYFKDTDGMTVHGFDSVHIGPNLPTCTEPSLYLGESKLYYRKNGKAGENGIKDLLEDIKSHFKSDFLRRESTLISKRQNNFPNIGDYEDKNTKDEYELFFKQKEYWYDVFRQVGAENLPLETFLKSVTVPLVCTYQSDIFEKCGDDTHIDFKKEYTAEIEGLQLKFKTLLGKIEEEIGEPIKTDLNIVLILFPIPSKKDLVKNLHTRLYNQQNA